MQSYGFLREIQNKTALIFHSAGRERVNKEHTHSRILNKESYSFVYVPGRHYSLEEAVINRVRSARYIQ